MRRNPSPHAKHRIARIAAVAAVGMLVLGACSKSGGDDAATTTSTTAAAKTTTTAAKGDASTSTTDGTGTPAGVDPWTRDAKEYRGKNGTTVKVACPAKGKPDTVWGVETYTDDSSICTAGVQVGLITLTKGGTVTIEIAAGRASYDAGKANGITSVRYGSWDGSFTFPDAPPGSGTFDTSAANWSDSAKSLGITAGAPKAVRCPGGGTIGSVWGTGTYTGDSSICTAAVLQGAITQDAGGEVTVTVGEGKDAYQGSTANGVTSLDYGAYDTSYTLSAATAKG